ncbi:MAG: hypothetical protein FJ291_02135 [Planctomycetes bacterium]|nr:hypothetical protein [Planctomycetota bacterium]
MTLCPIVLVLVVVLVLASSPRRGVAILSLASACLAAEPAADGLSRSKPLLIAKGQDYLVHGVSYPLFDDQARFRAPMWAGAMLLYTTPSNGEMKELVSTGTVEVPTERISFFQRRLLGVAADAERLYAVVWNSGRVFDHAPHPGQRMGGGTYTLRVFWLADGTPVTELRLIKKAHQVPPAPNVFAPGLPDAVVQETLDKGPLKLIEKGIACYGVAFEFEGKKLDAQRLADDGAAQGVDGLGKEIEYTGIARDGKLGAYVGAPEGKPPVVWLDDRRKWDPSLLGKKVTVTGILRMRMIGSDDGTTQAERQTVFHMTQYTLKIEDAPAPKP